MRYDVLTLREPTPGALVEIERKHPKLMRIAEPIAKVVDHFIENRLHHNLDRLETLAHPQEDCLATSSRVPAFAVADGVTLEFNADGTYPNPSGSSKAAELFCEGVIAEAEARYETFSEADVLALFRAGNTAVESYNRKEKRTRETSNWWDHDLFAATVAFGVLKPAIPSLPEKGDGLATLHWASLCDCYVAQYDSHMRLKFRSPECWPSERRCFPADWESRPEIDRKKEIKRTYRNGAEENGRLCGYGVATGEPAAEKFLNIGTLSLSPGDRVFLYSDGFEYYTELPEFLDLFHRWPTTLEVDLRALTDKKSREDGNKFGHERTLVALRALSNQ